MTTIGSDSTFRDSMPHTEISESSFDSETYLGGVS